MLHVQKNTRAIADVCDHENWGENENENENEACSSLFVVCCLLFIARRCIISSWVHLSTIFYETARTTKFSRREAGGEGMALGCDFFPHLMKASFASVWALRSPLSHAESGDWPDNRGDTVLTLLGVGSLTFLTVKGVREHAV